MYSNIITPERITLPGLILSRFAYLGAVPCVASNTADAVADVAARRDAEAADLRRGRVGDVVAVEVRRRDHGVLVGAQQDLLEHRVGDAVLDDERVGARGLPPSARSASVHDLVAELSRATS